MKHPTKAQVQIVIDNLKKAAAIAGNDCPVDMSEGEVDFNHPCGTPLCHGGWYALVKFKELPVHERSHNDYMNGALCMAEDLGFDRVVDFKAWAMGNPILWGNKYGDGMFSSGSALGWPENLNDIINHWQGVQSRLPE